jgi:NAD(P)-dependent dehydrogenase (short-subunit alcohol dehydrogenase family)
MTSSMTLTFDNRVAIVTGAGNGLGRSHALRLAERGVQVVVNDVGASRDGNGGSSSVAQAVVDETIRNGGDAISSNANVTKLDEVEDMVAKTIDKWGRVDILVNNAGILRDKTFAKMAIEDFRLVVDVYLNGSANCAKAVWGIMREQNYGRIVMTSSSSGLYGNFGQANYGAAKMGVVGLMNTLHLEGIRYGIRVNTLSPTAATRMTEDIIDEATRAQMTVESVSAALLFLASDEGPSRLILCAGAGGYAATQIFETDGIYLAPAEQTPENIASRLHEIVDRSGQAMFIQAGEQTAKFVQKAIDFHAPPAVNA